MSKTRVNISYSVEMADIPDKVSENINKISLCPSEFKELLDLFYNSMENCEFELACAALSALADKSEAVSNVSRDNLSILEGYKSISEQKDKLLEETKQEQYKMEKKDD
jgi:hypothetical protein